MGAVPFRSKIVLPRRFPSSTVEALLSVAGGRNVIRAAPRA
jgi:hypothetical protein